jgi:L-ribulose-5-phosphate 3-epimerase
MANIGIMQGRLVPPIEGKIQCFPRENWAKEFALAAQSNLDCIEWIYDLYGADVNPISTDHGIETIKLLSGRYGVKVLSVCADYFMDKPLLRADTTELEARFDKLAWLITRCQLLNINRCILPFVDASRIDTDTEMEGVITILRRALIKAEETGIELHLETSLKPNQFAMLLSRLSHPLLKANYDSGNSSSLGYHPNDEFGAYGKSVGSVHIKDRVHGGSTVPLGTGDADFLALFQNLSNVNYSGDFILQVARGASGDEVAWAKKNLEFVKGYLQAHRKS